MTARRLPRKRLAELEDDAVLLRQWRKWHAEQLAEALAGPHGGIVERLLEILNRLTLKSSKELIAFVSNCDWRTVDATTRFTLLHEINSAIAAMRERNGLASFDDSLPDQPPNVSTMIKAIIAP